jgi:LuxR family maltose regulon positive regulatory protein
LDPAVDAWAASLDLTFTKDDVAPFLAAMFGLCALRQYRKALKLHTRFSASTPAADDLSAQILSLTKALIEVDIGNFATVAELLQAAPLRGARTTRRGISWIVSSLYFIDARVLERLGRESEASDALWLGLRMAPANGLAEPLLAAYEAALALWRDPQRKPAIIEQLETHAKTYPSRVPRCMHWMKRSRLADLGLLEEVREFRHGTLTEPYSKTTAELAFERLSDVAVLAATDAPRATLRRLTALLSNASLLRRQDIVEANLMCCQLQLEDGDRDAAVRSIGKAIRGAAALNLVRPFCDHSVAIDQLLSSSSPAQLGLSRSCEIDFLKTLDSLLNPQRQNPDGIISAVPIEPLTPREIELLRLLDQGLTNKELGEALNLKTSTVKWHFYKVFSKLGVSNRGSALAVARSLGLLTATR